MAFDFSVPITWSDIISVISTLVALGAVIVAIVANCKASESLKYSLKMQEQSKNIDLFEKRVAIIDEIKKKGEASKLHLELLFDNKIVHEYEKTRKCFQYFEEAHHDYYIYGRILEEMDGDGDYTSPLAELQDAMNTLEKLNYPTKEAKNFEALCYKYQITHSESGEDEDIKVYNYKDLSERIASTETVYKKQRKELLDLMQKFIKNSISPINEKEN